MMQRTVADVAQRLVCCLAMACIPASRATGQEQHAPAGVVDRLAPDIPGVIAGGTRIRSIRHTFETPTLEGPIALPDGDVIFSERDKGYTWRIGSDDKVSIFLENPNTGPLGLAIDSRGRLIAVQTRPAERTRIAVIHPDAERAVLADNFDGKPFGRPNDLVIDRKGGVYFTAPGTSQAQVKEGYPAAESFVYYVVPNGRTIKIAGDIARPNGIQLSPDEKTLYVNDSAGEYLIAFDVAANGTVANRRNLARYQGTDRSGSAVIWPGANGMAIDAEGRLYAVTRTGIQVFTHDGRHLGTIPAQQGAENVAFAGPEKKTLYVTGGGVAIKVPMLAQGFKGRAK
jgi:gluconolactonase